MTSRRNLVLKFVIAALSMYLLIMLISSRPTSTFIRELQQSGRNLAALEPQTIVEIVEPAELKLPPTAEEVSQSQSSVIQIVRQRARKVEEEGGDINENKLMEKDAESPESKVADLEQEQESPEEKRSIYDLVREYTKCVDRPVVAKTQQRGDYWVLYNYVRPSRTFGCHESVTYTTHADYTFMDNLVPLMERWRGPLSIALHAPGADFKPTMESIAHLRDCTSPLVKEFVTFHVYFSTRHVPKEVPRHNKVFSEPYNCSLTPPYMNASSEQMYKTQKKLLYPVNVGRNVAREMATTHYILASDIELYPTPNIIEQFLTMIASNAPPLRSNKPKVFPLNLFEIAANQQVPETKTTLKEMVASGTAVPFHKKLCSGCHSIPMGKEWMAANETQGLHVFHVGKRMGKFVHWEPIFIGTHAEPLYDERLSWEGKSDKMTQGYALCVLDYEFLIIDNAFLVHKPGIKILKKDPKRAALAAKTNQLIKKIIFPELKVIYGVKKGCAV